MYTQFNEPGGICANENNDSIYIADTNNHSIKCLNLIDNTVSEVSLCT